MKPPTREERVAILLAHYLTQDLSAGRSDWIGRPIYPAAKPQP